MPRQVGPVQILNLMIRYSSVCQNCVSIEDSDEHMSRLNRDSRDSNFGQDQPACAVSPARPLPEPPILELLGVRHCPVYTTDMCWLIQPLPPARLSTVAANTIINGQWIPYIPYSYPIHTNIPYIPYIYSSASSALRVAEPLLNRGQTQ